MLSKCSFVVFFFSHFAFSQSRVGNGGNVVDCPTTIQVLDLYEMQNTPRIKVGVQDHRSITKDVFERLSIFSKKLGSQYLERLDSIYSEIDFKDGVALVSTKDSLHVFKPEDKGCEIKQVAIRKEVVSKKEKRFVFDKKLWDRLDEENKAALIVHEVIYEHYNRLGEVESTRVRKVVGALFQENIDGKEFWTLIKDLKLKIYPD